MHLRCEHGRRAVTTETNGQQGEYIAKGRIERENDANGASKNEGYWKIVSRKICSTIAKNLHKQ
jgi:hypothetical protein